MRLYMTQTGRWQGHGENSRGNSLITVLFYFRLIAVGACPSLTLIEALYWMPPSSHPLIPEGVYTCLCSTSPLHVTLCGWQDVKIQLSPCPEVPWPVDRMSKSSNPVSLYWGTLSGWPDIKIQLPSVSMSHCNPVWLTGHPNPTAFDLT